MRKGGARPGDRLLLTKRLGTGLLVSGSRRGRTAANDLAAASRPDAGPEPGGIGGARRAGVTAATDVTGFGLLGHGLEIARATVTRLMFEAAALPASPGALELAAAGVETGGAAHNRRFVGDVAGSRRQRRAPEIVRLAHDPQTCGGLLAALSPDRVAAVEVALTARSVEHCVGRVGRGRRGRHRDRRTDLAISARTAHAVGAGARHARAMRQRITLAAIKAVHTVAFALIATSILTVFLDGLAGSPHPTNGRRSRNRADRMRRLRSEWVRLSADANGRAVRCATRFGQRHLPPRCCCRKPDLVRINRPPDRHRPQRRVRSGEVADRTSMARTLVPCQPASSP